MTPNNTTALPRVDALDALRGLAILAMVFSATIRYKILPNWMYHAQVPPPNHVFNKGLPGLTWVDLVFPLFLFSMGAAIPLALSRRLAQGWSMPKIILQILKRGAILGAFAIILEHLRPSVINADLTRETWVLAMVGFGLLFLMLGHLPIAWRLSRYQPWITLVGWLAGFGLISQLDYDGKGFSLALSDPILISLANMAIFGSFLWLLTRSNWMLRLGLLVILLALQFASGSEGWVQKLWRFSPAPWIFQFYYLKYLFIVIPGTIAGDLILQHAQKERALMNADNLQPVLKQPIQPAWSRSQLILIAGSMLLLCVILLVGLQARWILETILISGIMLAAISLLFTKTENETEQKIKQFYQWGAYWLALGLCFEPFQVGIKKDPSTYSYYFVTTGVAFFLLIVFTIWSECFHQKRSLKLLIENGQNPMIAYVAFANLLWPILQLSGLEGWIIAHTGTQILGVLKGVGYTGAIALFTSFCTRQKFFWKT